MSRHSRSYRLLAHELLYPSFRARLPLSKRRYISPTRFLVICLFFLSLTSTITAAPCANQYHPVSLPLPELISPVQTTFPSKSPLLIGVLLTFAMLGILLRVISIFLIHLSNQHPQSLWLACAPAVTLTVSYSISWFTTTVLCMFVCITASTQRNDTAIAVLVITCSLSYLFNSVFFSPRQLVRHIPHFNRLRSQQLNGLAPTFRMLLYLALNQNSSSCFSFEYRLCLAMFALIRGYKTMLDIVLCCTNPSIGCSYTLQMLTHRLSDLDQVPVSVQHLVPAALTTLTQLAVADSTQRYVQLVDRVYYNLNRGDAECLETFLDSVHRQDADLLSLYLRSEAR